MIWRCRIGLWNGFKIFLRLWYLWLTQESSMALVLNTAQEMGSQRSLLLEREMFEYEFSQSTYDRSWRWYVNGVSLRNENAQRSF